MLTQQQRNQLEEQGFLLLVDFSTAAEMDHLQVQIETLFTREGEAAGSEFKQELHSRRLSNLVNKGEIFRRLVSQPDVLEMVQIVLGEQYKLSSLNARSANPGQPAGQPLHADMGAVADATGPWVCNIIWLVDEFTDENGCLRVIPGSHRANKLPQDTMADPLAAHPQEVLVTGPRGSLIVLNAHLWHGGTANRTAGSRTALHGFYCRRDKPQQQYQKKLIDLELQRSFSPELRHLLALDDTENDRLAGQEGTRSGFLK